jgi:glycine hydroxymethyltransferase
MCDVIDARGDAATIEQVKGQVLALCARFPVYRAHAG